MLRNLELDDSQDGGASGFVYRKKRKLSALLAFLLLLGVGAYFVQSTLAANISLTSGEAVEFGQGITQLTACSGSTALTITPNSSFVNQSGGGSHYFSSVTVSDIPSSCYGKDFKIKAYGDTSQAPLSLFNSTSTDVVIFNDGGTFKLGAESRGMTLTRSAGTFTATFRTPVALASSVFSITIESGEHVEWVDVYNIGDIGPGGGTVFYFDAAGFNCGTAFSSSGSPNGGKCNYLEAAPRSWRANGTPEVTWGDGAFEPIRVPAPGAIETAIGSGYRNTLAIIAQGSSDPMTSASALAQSYRNGEMTDWYLPSKDELYELYLKRDVVATSLFSPHWSSSERSGAGNDNLAYFQSFSNGGYDVFSKFGVKGVFPIRAF